MTPSYPCSSHSVASNSRRSFLKRVVAGAIAMPLFGCSAKKQKPPNIVLIISDDQGWNDYGFMGHKTIQTPHLDKLASESVLFTRGYVAAPLCCPSLASIITGLHPHQHKVTSNDPPFNKKGARWDAGKWSPERRQLRERIIANFTVPTLPKMLAQQGYSSLQTGKWWMGHYSNGGFTHGMTHGDMDRGGRHGDEGLEIGRKGMQPIFDFINDVGEQPFFIWYAPFLPHTPHNPPERLLNKYRDKSESLHVARYWAMCEWFDETCGDLLDFLDNKGLADNTMILYVCDNGWIQRPEKGGYAVRSKRTPYEGGIRTPIMVKWPGHTTPKRDKTTLVSSIDLAPTILKACGLEATAEMQGADLLNEIVLEKRNLVYGAAYTHDAVDPEKPLTSLQYSYIVKDEWKMIQPSGQNETKVEPELYQVMTDPQETTNVAEENGDVVIYLQEQINKWFPGTVPSKEVM
jgi:arylsulfatase A-like enzyme